eukprot:SAG31_NODE_19069_length_613_cov_0.723735_2_plen_89_part_00
MYLNLVDRYRLYMFFLKNIYTKFKFTAVYETAGCYQILMYTAVLSVRHVPVPVQEGTGTAVCVYDCIKHYETAVAKFNNSGLAGLLAY